MKKLFFHEKNLTKQPKKIKKSKKSKNQKLLRNQKLKAQKLILFFY